MRVHLWQYLRTGFEGFVSTMPSGMTDCKDILQNGSYVRVGCGGVLADCCWRLDNVWPYIGGVIGGGSILLHGRDGNDAPGGVLPGHSPRA